MENGQRPRSIVYGVLAFVGFPILLTLGYVVSFATNGPNRASGVLFLLSILPSLVFGILAGVSALRGLKATPNEPENRSARKQLKVGLTLGSLGVLVMTPLYTLVLISLFGSSAPLDRDAMIDDMLDIRWSAREHRLRPVDRGGGEGSFRGYAVPEDLSKTRHGEYEVLVFDDSLIIVGHSKEDTTSTVTVAIDSAGQLHFRSATGNF